MRLIGFSIYLGIGAMLHAVFIGAAFDWSSAWTFAWLFGWPIMLFGSFFGFLIEAVVVVAGCYLLWSWADMIGRWQKRRAHR